MAKNLWHDIKPKSGSLINVVIEIPRNSREKYEFNKKTNKITVDRILPKGLRYPLNYGFIPQTYDDDKDPLDAVVFSHRKYKKGSILKCKCIGILRVIDNKRRDDKIVMVPSRSKITKLSRDTILLMKCFYETYKHGVTILGYSSKKIAEKEIQYTMKRYLREFSPDKDL